jgi:hypothetical protein
VLRNIEIVEAERLADRGAEVKNYLLAVGCAAR